MFARLLFSLVISLSCVGCGYHFHEATQLPRRSSLSVPYVQGDTDGHLTAALVHRVANSAAFQYAHEEGDLILKVKLLPVQTDNIGFKYAQGDAPGGHNHTVANETRLTAKAEVCVFSKTGEQLLGPVELSALQDYAFEPDASFDALNAFSLGQFDPYGGAEDAAHRPLYQSLALTIVTFIEQAW